MRSRVDVQHPIRRPSSFVDHLTRCGVTQYLILDLGGEHTSTEMDCRHTCVDKNIVSSSSVSGFAFRNDSRPRAWFIPDQN